MRKVANRTALDYIIIEAIENVAAERAHFTKRDILHAVMTDSRIMGIVKGLYERFDRKWHLDVVFTKYVKGRVGHFLQTTKDGNGLRVYESYSAGDQERRWQPLRAMTRTVLSVVVAEHRTLRGQIDAKIRRYELILGELQKYTDRTHVDTVYSDAVKKIRIEEAKKSA